MAVDLIIGAFAAYSAFGFAFGIVFVSTYIQRIDPAAANTSLAFRLMVLPGAAALWPVLLPRCRRGGSA
jgi:hypothetical protein